MIGLHHVMKKRKCLIRARRWILKSFGRTGHHGQYQLFTGYPRQVRPEVFARTANPHIGTNGTAEPIAQESEHTDTRLQVPFLTMQALHHDLTIPLHSPIPVGSALPPCITWDSFIEFREHKVPRVGPDN